MILKKNQNESEWKHRLVNFVIFSPILVFIGILIYRLKYTEKTTGKVVENDFKIKIEYIVDNKVYPLEFYNLKLRRFLSTGQNIPIYYVKNNPQDASLNGRETSIEILLFITIIISIIMSVCFYYKFIKFYK